MGYLNRKYEKDNKEIYMYLYIKLIFVCVKFSLKVLDAFPFGLILHNGYIRQTE
jgi:hypothetical protein